jgi:hypothetical protein
MDLIRAKRWLRRSDWSASAVIATPNELPPVTYPNTTLGLLKRYASAPTRIQKKGGFLSGLVGGISNLRWRPTTV